MDSHEVERLIVRILADTKQYHEDMQSTLEKTQETAKGIESAVSGIGIKTVAVGELIAEGIKFAAGKFLEFKNEALSAFANSEIGGIRFNAILEANGRAASDVMARYKRFAEQQEEITATSKGTTMQLLKSAETYGVTGEQAERAARNAIALEAATGHSATALIRATTAAEQGNVSMLRYMLRLRGVKNEAELNVKVQQLLKAGYAAAKAGSDSYIGTTNKLKFEMHGLMTEIGKFVAEKMKPMVEWSIIAVRWLRSLSPETKKWGVAIGSLSAFLLSLRPILQWLMLPAVKFVFGFGAAWKAFKEILSTVLSPLFMVLNFLFSLKGILIIGAAAILYFTGVFGGLWTKIDGFIDDILTRLQPMFKIMMEGFAGFKKALMNQQWDLAVKIAWATVKAAFLAGMVEIDKALGGGLTKAINWVWQKLGKVTKWLYAAFQGVKLEWNSLVKSIIDGILSITVPLQKSKAGKWLGIDFGNLNQELQAASDKRKSTIDDIGAAVTKFEEDVNKAMAAGMVNFPGWLKIAKERLDKLLKQVKESKEPEDLGFGIGKSVGEGVKKGIDSTRIDAAIWGSLEHLLHRAEFIAGASMGRTQSRMRRQHAATTSPHRKKETWADRTLAGMGWVDRALDERNSPFNERLPGMGKAMIGRAIAKQVWGLVKHGIQEAPRAIAGAQTIMRHMAFQESRRSRAANYQEHLQGIRERSAQVAMGNAARTAAIRKTQSDAIKAANEAERQARLGEIRKHSARASAQNKAWMDVIRGRAEAARGTVGPTGLDSLQMQHLKRVPFRRRRVASAPGLVAPVPPEEMDRGNALAMQMLQELKQINKKTRPGATLKAAALA